MLYDILLTVLVLWASCSHIWEFIFCYVAKIFHETFGHTPAKYMTLGPKFFCFSKMAVTRRIMHLNQYFLAGSPALDVSYLSSRSKQDWKHFSKIDLLGFAAIVFPYSCQAYIIYNIMLWYIYIYIIYKYHNIIYIYIYNGIYI